MMTHFSMRTQYTLGVDRDQALEMAIRGRTDANLLNEWRNGNEAWQDFRPPRRFVTTEKEKKHVGLSDLVRCYQENCLVIACLFLRADNELYQTINSGLIRLEYFDIFKDSKEHLERLRLSTNHCGRTSFSLTVELANYVSSSNLRFNLSRLFLSWES